MINLKNLKSDRAHEYSADKAPHKAVLLLTTIKLFENKKIDIKKINFRDPILSETYKSIWKCLNYNKVGSISLPLFHLISDGFYKIHNKNKTLQKPGGSLVKLLRQADTAEFNYDFIKILNDKKSRKAAIEELLTGGYFSSNEISKLNVKLSLLDKSFDYEKKLKSIPKNKFSNDFPLKLAEYSSVRKESFRRLILQNYKTSCAICKASIIVNNVSIVDAAHILPYAEFHNDDPRNGIALCKTHHWLFDNGALSISPDYRVKISNEIQEETPEGYLSQYFRKKILLPENEKYYPAKEALEWHNHRWNYI